MIEILKGTFPDLWEQANYYDIKNYAEVPDATGEMKTIFTSEWTDEMKEEMESDDRRKALYFIEDVFPDLRDISLMHGSAPPTIAEKVKYLFTDPWETTKDIGGHLIGSTVTESILDKHYNKEFGDWVGLAESKAEEYMNRRDDTPWEEKLINTHSEVTNRMHDELDTIIKSTDSPVAQIKANKYKKVLKEAKG